MKKLLLIFVHSILWRKIFTFFVGLRFYNTEILKHRKQYILIANHNSHLDSMAIMSAIPFKNIHRVHPIAAENFFSKNAIKKFMMVHFVNAVLIPTRRAKNEGESDPIEMMGKLLRHGESIILYPEGTRGEPGVMQDFKKGLALLIQMYPDIDVIPIYIEGLHQTMPKGASLILPYNCKMYVGNPITFDSYKIEDILGVAKSSILDAKNQSSLR